MSNDDSTKAPERFLMSPPLPSPHDSPAPGPEVEVTFGARSRRGPLRFQNDDHYLVTRLGRYQDTLLTSLSDEDVPRAIAYFLKSREGAKLYEFSDVNLVNCFGSPPSIGWLQRLSTSDFLLL